LDSNPIGTPAGAGATDSALWGLDIGLVLQCGQIQHLPQGVKLDIVNHTPSASFKYPTKFLNGCNRHFKVEWATLHPWVHYSVSDDGVYCKACALFAPGDAGSQKLGTLVNKPFSVWTKQSFVFQKHEECNYHQDSMAKMVAFKESCSSATHNVACMLNNEREQQIARNTVVMKSLFDCICFIGKRGQAYRGHRDDYTASEDDDKGNFIDTVEFRAKTDEVLRTHLETAPRNALYTSKTIQNDMISVAGNAIRNEIIKEMKVAKYFSILADEATDYAGLEQVSIVFRFVDKDKQIREEFLDFLTVKRITGELISSALLARIQEMGLDIAFCRGQGYDGASNMSSSNVGVQARIRQVSPLALYSHCQSHRLNLCVVKACSVPQIRNASGVVSEIGKYFRYSGKRQHFFEEVMESISPAAKKVKLKDLCKTWWVERVDAYLVFYDLYPALIETMKAINTCDPDYGDWAWDQETMTRANGFYLQLKSFQFLVAFSVAMRILSILRSLTIKLQKKANDILAAYELVSDVLLELELLKINCEDEFHSWYEEMKTLADELNIPVGCPRITARQAHRSNIPADTPEAYTEETS
jgi:hypothetical protein